MEMEPYKHTLNVPYLVVCRCAGSREPPSKYLVLGPASPIHPRHSVLQMPALPHQGAKVKIHKVTLRRKRSIGPFPQNSA